MNRERSFIVVDIETTGFSPKTGGITEITALSYDMKFDHVQPVVNSLFNPLYPIPKNIMVMTGITNKMVKYMFPFTEGITQLVEGLHEDDILVAHNAGFEKRWFAHHSEVLSQQPYICTQALWLYFKDGNFSGRFIKNNSKLKNVCEALNIGYNETDAHRAEYDVLKTAKVAEYLIKEIGLETALTVSKEFMKGVDKSKRKNLFESKQLRFTL